VRPSTFALIHGGGGGAWDWHLVEGELRARGHDVVAVDLPSEDPTAGLEDYADVVVDAIGDRTDLVVVGHSFGGFTAPLVCDRLQADLLVLVAAMIPAPGERPAEWWSNTGHQMPDGADDPIATFLHDVPPELADEMVARERDTADAPMEQPWPLDAWPDVPTRFLLPRDDRCFSAGWMRGVVLERLGVVPDEIDGGHCVMLSRPRELADRLEGYAAEQGGRAADAAARA
jgi:pimeloyl-ACP methyl ester carboxylesterase